MAECVNKIAPFHPFMETPDQNVHHAMTTAATRRGEECGWKPDTMFHHSNPGLPPRTPANRAGSIPRFDPQTPSRGLHPSRPPGERGDLF